MNWATGEINDAPRRWWRLALIAAAVLVVAGVVGTVFTFRHEAERVGRLLADIRARGEPVTGAELDAFYARPKSEEDATDLWVTALTEVERTIQVPRSGEYCNVPIQGNTESSGRQIPLPGASWDDLALSQRYLREVAASMDALHAAAAFGGHARYPGSIADITSTAPLARLQTLRNASRRLQLEACVRAHERDSAGMADTLHAVLMLAQSARDEPTTITMLVRLAIHGVPVSLLLRFLPHIDFSDEDLATLQRDLAGIEFREQLWRSTCGERALCWSLFEQVSGAPVADVTALAYRLTRPLDEATYLAMMSDWVALAKKPWLEMLAEDEAVAAKWDAQRSPLHPLSHTISPGCGISIDAVARAEALNRFALLAVALSAMRRIAGQPPQSLQDLVPDFIAAVPDDPFTGEPFCYENEGSRYVLYSKAQRDLTKMALRTAKTLDVDPSYLLEDAAKKMRVPTGSMWELPAATNPYLLFRWPPLPEPPTVVP